MRRKEKAEVRKRKSGWRKRKIRFLIKETILIVKLIKQHIF